MSALHTICIAWTTRCAVFDGKEYARDLGRSPGMRTVWEPKACVWINEGTDEDLAKAQAFCARENRGLDPTTETPRVVLSYPTTEKDPLGAAKRDVQGPSPRGDA